MGEGVLRFPLHFPPITSCHSCSSTSKVPSLLSQSKYYEQVQGAAMGCPLSPVVANFFLEDFEARALTSSPNLPRTLLRLVNNTFIAHKAEHTQFLSHLNSLDPTYNSQLNPQTNMALFPSWALNIIKLHGTLITVVYRKPSHADQYLHWGSQHSITNKYIVYNTLSHRTQYVCSNQELLEQENQYIHMALGRCNYPDWVFHKLQTKMTFQLSHQQWHQQQQPPQGHK